MSDTSTNALAEGCYFCRRALVDGTWTRMTFGGTVRSVCDDCAEKGEDRYSPDEILVIANQSGVLDND